MNTIFKILEELNLQNGSNYKLSVLKQYRNNKQLARVLQMTHDRVKYTYGLSANRWISGDLKSELITGSSYSLDEVLDFMVTKLSTREITGNEAVHQMHTYLCGLSAEDQSVTIRILNRDLRINMGRTQINKIFPDLIMKPCYMRCGVFNSKSAKDINYPAYIQLKADGTYREAFVLADKVEFVSRSGEPYSYPILETCFANAPEGHYTGELLVRDTTNRSESNGLINSSDPPHDIIDFYVWDYITPEEYLNAHNKIDNTTTYVNRFKTLTEIVNKLNHSNLHLIENHLVHSVDEALLHTSKWMVQGLEGGVLKDLNGIYKNGTSKHQLKLKLEMDVDVRIVGFQEGTPGTIREKTFGAIIFKTDDNQIVGRTSGFTDEQLFDFNSRRDELIGTIMAVKCNDITRGRDSDHYALSHPRFIELRTDKTETDTFERVIEIKEMAKGLK